MRAALLLLLLAGCATIDYTHRVRAPATDVEWRYSENAGAECRQMSSMIGYFDVACTFFPDALGWDDKDPTHWLRAIVVVPLSEKANPGYISRREQGHVDGFDH